MAKKKDTLKYVKQDLWPKTKKELEKGMKSTKKILDKGEKYLKSVSEKGLVQTKKLSLNLKKEKLYYDLGKVVAKISCEKWSSNNKIENIVKQIKALDRKISQIK